MSSSRHRVTPRLILGLAILILGVLLTLENLGLMDIRPVLGYWPLALILVGLAKVFLVGGRAVFGGFIWLFLGLLFLLRNLGVLPFEIINLWPLALVLVGAGLVSRALLPRPRSTGPRSDDELSGVAVLTGIHRRSTSPTFRGADFTAIMGGCEVDLTGADIQDGEAVIDLFTFWGGIDLRVPRSWSITPNVTVLMGGLDDSTNPAEADPKKSLIIRGTAIMGGVRLSN